MNDSNFVGPYREPHRKSDKYMPKAQRPKPSMRQASRLPSISFSEAYRIMKAEMRWRDRRKDLSTYAEALRSHIALGAADGKGSTTGRGAAAQKLLAQYDAEDGR